MKTEWLKGRTVVVAGATGAIGQATCASLLDGGATVIAVGRDLEKLSRLKAALVPHANRLHLLPVKRFDHDSCELVLGFASRLNSGIDAFIHAAGRTVPGGFLELTAGQIDSIINTNFRSVIAAASVVIPRMIERHTGHFIVVGSLGGIVPMPFETMYSATKFALRGFCLSLHEEVRHQGVTVSLLSPGPVRSPMLDLESSDPRAALTFVDTPVEPARIAESIVGLLKVRKREIVRPALQRYKGLIVNIFPSVFGSIYPLLSAIGRRRLKRYRKTTNKAQDHSHDDGRNIQAA